MRLLQRGGESGIRTHEGLHPTAFRERHFRPLRHLSTAEYSISPGVWQAEKLAHCLFSLAYFFPVATSSSARESECTHSVCRLRLESSRASTQRKRYDVR